MRISVTEAGVNNAKLGGVAGGECECGDDVGLVGFLVRERRFFDILPVEKKKRSCLQVKCQEKRWVAVDLIRVSVRQKRSGQSGEDKVWSGC